MQWEFIDRPDFTMLSVTFDARGEQLVTEAGAMVARDEGIEMKTTMRGGLLKSAKRALFGGESLFVNTYTARAQGDRLFVAAAPEGDIEAFSLEQGEEIILQGGAFIASTQGVELDTKWAGFRGFFAGEGFFFLRAKGPGTVFAGTFGALHPVDITPARPWIIDTGHIVAFEPSLDFHVQKVGNLKSLFLSGEGLVVRFEGRGRVWAQTRNPGPFAWWLNRFRPVRRSSD